MTLRNSETQAVRLVPRSPICSAAAAAGSPRHSRVHAGAIESGAAGAKRRHVSLTVPADADAGCYSGLLVVRGVDYLRALITIDVV